MSASHSSAGRDLKSISGFADYEEWEHIQIGMWIDALKNVFSSSGFTPFYPRPAEYTENLVKKGGIAGQIYVIGRLQDMSMTDLALPFDRTIPLALWVSRHAMNIVFPFKRYDISYSWRGEHAQKGRFRAFFQADVDILGRNLSLLADAECIGAIWRALRAIHIPDFHQYLNHMNISRSLIAQLNPQPDQVEKLLVIVDKIEKISKEDMLKEIRALLPDRSEEELENFYTLMHFKGNLRDFPLDKISQDPVAVEAFGQLQELFSLLESYQIDPTKIQFCPSMVRGLNYYTGVVFETFLDSCPQGGSIASGGRYKDLIAKVSDNPTNAAFEIEGVGASIGVTRLFELLKAQYQKGLCTTASVLIAYRDDSEKGASFQKRSINIASVLRDKGIWADVYCAKQKLKSILSFANKKGYPFLIAIMDDGSIVVRDLKSNSQEDLSSDHAAVETFLRKISQKNPSF